MKDKYTEQLKFVKTLAERLPDVKPCVTWYRENGEPSKQQTLDDIKRLRRELLELAHIVEQI